LVKAGAPQPVTDVSSTVAAGTPGSLSGQIVGHGALGWFNIGGALAGDPRGVDRQAKMMLEGEGGPVLQLLAMETSFYADLASGKGVEKSFEAATKPGANTPWARLGTNLGDVAFQEQDIATDIVRDVLKGKSPADAIDQAEKKNRFAYGSHAVSQRGGAAAPALALAKVVARQTPKAVNAARQQMQKVEVKVRDTVEATKQAVGNGASQLKQAVQNAPEQVQAFVAEKVQQAEQFKQGLEQGAEQVKDKVIAKGKQFLDRVSPFK